MTQFDSVEDYEAWLSDPANKPPKRNEGLGKHPCHGMLGKVVEIPVYEADWKRGDRHALVLSVPKAWKSVYGNVRLEKSGRVIKVVMRDCRMP